MYKIVEKMYDILIIGSGPAGLTAAIYAIRANKRVALVEGHLPGGQLMKTTEIENFPGFAHPIGGPELMEAMKQQALNLNVEFISEYMNSFEKIGGIFAVNLTSQQISAKSLILATGSTPLQLGIEEGFLGKGVSTCATCDGFFFKKQDVCVIGGGNSALEEAIYLSSIARKVYLIHRRNEFRGEKILQDRLQSKTNIEILTPYQTSRFVGEKALESVVIEHVETKDTIELKIAGAFIAIGHTPNTQYLKGLIQLDEQGYVVNGVKTEMPGLFVSGDMFDSQYRQAITSAGLGCMAALEAIKYLEH
jgi:thioredoxin reductase (NADPH)